MLVALRELATNQTIGISTSIVFDGVVHFLNYATTHPNPALKYHASGTILHVESNILYLLVSKTRSRVGGNHHLSAASKDYTKPLMTDPPPNGPVHTVCSIMKNVILSTAEAEMGGLSVNGQEAIILRTILDKIIRDGSPTTSVGKNM